LSAAAVAAAPPAALVIVLEEPDAVLVAELEASDDADAEDAVDVVALVAAEPEPAEAVWVVDEKAEAEVTAPLTAIAAALADAADTAVVVVAVVLDATPEDDVSVVFDDVPVVVELVVEFEPELVVDDESVVEFEPELVDDEGSVVEFEPELAVDEPVDEVVVLLEAPLELTETVQLWTSCTAGLPLASVTGVRVTTQVCVTGPSGVMELDTVIKVVGAARPAEAEVVACRL